MKKYYYYLAAFILMLILKPGIESNYTPTISDSPYQYTNPSFDFLISKRNGKHEGFATLNAINYGRVSRPSIDIMSIIKAKEIISPLKIDSLKHNFQVFHSIKEKGYPYPDDEERQEELFENFQDVELDSIHENDEAEQLDNNTNTESLNEM